MTLLDEAVKLTFRVGIPCVVGNLKESDPALYAELQAALEAPVQVTAISRALKEHGIVMAPDILARHRRGDCVRCRS